MSSTLEDVQQHLYLLQLQQLQSSVLSADVAGWVPYGVAERWAVSGIFVGDVTAMLSALDRSSLGAVQSTSIRRSSADLDRTPLAARTAPVWQPGPDPSGGPARTGPLWRPGPDPSGGPDRTRPVWWPGRPSSN